MIETPERVSLELHRRCQKACHFCYNQSGPDIDEAWTPEEVINFVKSITKSGTKALSLGGGEPLEYEGLEEVFEGLKETPIFLSMTSNGLLLEENYRLISKLSPDKIHLSIHFPKRGREVDRVISQVLYLRSMGIRTGVNFLIGADQIDACILAAKKVRSAGIGNDSIMYLPMRGKNTPTPEDVYLVAGEVPFQSMTCLSSCEKSAAFCSIDAKKKVAHCSYTSERRTLKTLDASGLSKALEGLGLVFCG